MYAKLPAALPSGCAAVPIVAGSTGPVRLCVVVKLNSPAGTSGSSVRVLSGPGGPFIPLRETYDASVVLGCIADIGGKVQQWVELWIQNLDYTSPKMSTAKEVFTNKTLDKRWAERADQYSKSSPGGIIRTGFEDTHPQPTVIDLRRAVAMLPTDPRTGKAWMLCEDDRLLESKDLPAYSTTLHRYLYQPDADALTAFVPLSPDAPKPASASGSSDVREAMGLSSEVAVFNPGGGLLMALPHAPVGAENYIQALTLLGTEDGSISLLQTAGRAISRNFSDAGAADDASMMFLSRHGLTGRLLETLYHKLALLADATMLVRATTCESQEPMLNLGTQSFRVFVQGSGGGLPFLWSSRVALANPGAAVTLPVKTTERKLFGSMDAETRSVYNPASSSRTGGAWGELRVRRVSVQDEQLILEGTLTTQERVSAASRDCVWMRFGLGSGRVDLFATLEARSAMASGELRVRSIPQKLPQQTMAELKAAEGMQVPEVFFEVAPLLSTPADLYSLAVMGVRTLLVDAQTTLAVALDEFMSLARQVGTEHDAATPLATRVGKVLRSDERFMDALGPHRLTGMTVEPAHALEIVPFGLWCQVLASMVRALPGVGPDSTCRDLGDAPADAIEKVFDPYLTDLYALVRKVRSMIVSDPAADAELHDLVRQAIGR